jgi:2-keto-4-pentenoate hydratase/2-oxohepta-3-ene-1,7-dioic acid hydratase in catechol pathway
MFAVWEMVEEHEHQMAVEAGEELVLSGTVPGSGFDATDDPLEDRT